MTPVSMAPVSMAPVAAAEAAAEAVRALSRASLSGSGYATPAEVDAVIAEVAVLVARLPQVLTQAARWLMRENEARAVFHDAEGALGGLLASVVVTEADLGLAEAAYRAARLGEALEKVRESTTHLGGVPALERTA
jgi:hypothetical protein